MASGDSFDSDKRKSDRSSSFCPGCGEAVGQSHKFCRHCGESLAEPDAPDGATPDKAREGKNQKKGRDTGASDVKDGGADVGSKIGDDDEARPRLKIGSKADVGKKAEPGAAKPADPNDGAARAPIGERVAEHKWLAAGVGASLLVVVIVVGLLLTGAVAGGASDSEVASFRKGMLQRNQLLLAQAKYQSAMVTSRKTVQRYFTSSAAYDAEVKRIDIANQPLYDACQAAYSNISCPSPTYPDSPKAPSVSDEVSQLRKVSNATEALGAKIRSTDPPDSLKAFYSQLTSAVDKLQEDATYNADTLTKAVTPAKGEATGSVDKPAIATLKSQRVSPSIRALNAQAVEEIKRLGLQLSDFDVPGGTDSNPDDASAIT